MKYLILTLIAGMMSTGLTGCDSSESSGGDSVGTVKVSEVMREVGDESEIEAKLTKMKLQRGKELEEIRISLQDEINKKKKAIGEKPSDIEKRELVVLAQQSETTFRKNQMKSNTDYTNYRNALVAAKREEYVSAIERISKKRGLTLVIFSDGGGVAYADQNSNITKDTIAAIKADRKANGRAEITPTPLAPPTPFNPPTPPKSTPPTPPTPAPANGGTGK